METRMFHSRFKTVWHPLSIYLALLITGLVVLTSVRATRAAMLFNLEIEAESGTRTSPMTVGNDASASGGQYLFSGVNSSGQVRFTVNVPGGNYTVWCRVIGETQLSDSFYVSVDGGTEDIYDVVENTWSGSWQWTKVNGRAGRSPLTLNPRAFTLSEGLHVFTFRAREENTRLDKLIITDDNGFNPSALTGGSALTPIPTPTPTPPQSPTTLSGFYASPNGSRNGDGSIGNPWDLQTALNWPASVGPGATIWMRGGTYRGCFTSFLSGSPGAPVTLRQYPGERATIDSYGGSCSVTFNVVGSWSVMQGFEVMYSGPSRTSARPIGVNVLGTHTKLVNLIVHDNGEGIGFWNAATDSEVYGCIIYNNGTYDYNRGWGSGIYSQNSSGTKRIADNIAFNQFGNGTQIQGSDQTNVSGYQIEGNAIFNNGSPLQALKLNLVIGSGQPAERISVTNNYLYMPDATATNTYLGYSDALNKDLVVRDNDFGGGGPTLQLGGWEQVTLTGNKFHGSYYLINLARPNLFGWSRSVWDYNSYHFSGGSLASILSIQYQGFGLFNWQQLTGYDRNSSFVSGLSGFDVLIRPNQYEPGRAHIIILNYDLRNSAAINPSGVLRVGQEYEIRDAQNYFGAPVVTGVYDGNPISINLAALTSVAAPVGLGAPGSEAVRLPAHTPRAYNALVLVGR